MSSFPGDTLEDLIEDNFTVHDGPRFDQLVKFYEPHRSHLEHQAEGFDKETMSWRDYRYGLWEGMPDPPDPVELPDVDVDGTEYPVCPSCGEADQDWWDGAPQVNDGTEFSKFCHTCMVDYKVTAHVDITFSTELEPKSGAKRKSDRPPQQGG